MKASRYGTPRSAPPWGPARYCFDSIKRQERRAHLTLDFRRFPEAQLLVPLRGKTGETMDTHHRRSGDVTVAAGQTIVNYLLGLADLEQ